MKDYIKISCFFWVLLLSQFAVAQTTSTTQKILNPNVRSQVLPSISQNQLQNKNNQRNISTSSNVFILQVGNHNNIISDTRSNNADINLLQQGSKNQISLSLSSQNITENVIQSGNNHNFIDVNSKASYLHSTNVIQQGANQNLIRIGANSMSDNLIINMRGKDQTVLIRSIKR